MIKTITVTVKRIMVIFIEGSQYATTGGFAMQTFTLKLVNQPMQLSPTAYNSELCM